VKIFSRLSSIYFSLDFALSLAQTLALRLRCYSPHTPSRGHSCCFIFSDDGSFLLAANDFYAKLFFEKIHFVQTREELIEKFFSFGLVSVCCRKRCWVCIKNLAKTFNFWGVFVLALRVSCSLLQKVFIERQQKPSKFQNVLSLGSG
jgi:hypothetical protein